MKMIVDALKVARTYIWKNYMVEGRLHCVQLYELSEKAEPQQGKGHTRGMPYAGNITRWEGILSKGECINSPVKDLPLDEQTLFLDQGIVSILIVPVFIKGEFWGYVGFDDCFNERTYSDDDVAILRSCSVLFGNAWLRNEMLKSLQDTSAKLESALEQAKAANKAKSDFLSTVSHEIRTPLNAILGITEIQLQTGILQKEAKEAFEKIYVSGDLLLGIINDILDLSKIEAGKLELASDSYEISSLISDTVQLNLMRIGSKQIEFKLLVDENMPALLKGDELRIKQVLNNLLSNAFKYTEAGSVSLTVGMKPGHAVSGKPGSPQSEDDITVLFRVSDTGSGLTRDQVDKLFDEYSRFNMESNRTIEGTGLGMSIVSKLLFLMDGKITIESEPGKGSTFTVSLPQSRVSQAVLGKETASSLSKFSFNSGANLKRVQITRTPMPYGSVLVVDDVETNVYVARGLLIPYGLQIDSASSGFEAIDKVKSGKIYDIIFMDHMMPKMDGIEATKIIKGMGYQQPIIALTANAVMGQADMFLGNGFDDFIAKPIDLRQLNAMLNKFIKDKYPAEAQQIAQQETQETQEIEQVLLKKASTITLNQRIVDAFARDAGKSIALLESILSKREPYTEDDYHAYDTSVHGMKSALAQIGKMELSAMAYKLEMSVHGGKNELMRSETMAFLDSLRLVVSELTSKDETEITEPSDEDKAFLKEKLLVIKDACEEYDERTADDAVISLMGKSWPIPTQELLESIAKHLLHSDFEEAAELADRQSKLIYVSSA